MKKSKKSKDDPQINLRAKQKGNPEIQMFKDGFRIRCGMTEDGIDLIRWPEETPKLKLGG